MSLQEAHIWNAIKTKKYLKIKNILKIDILNIFKKFKKQFFPILFIGVLAYFYAIKNKNEKFRIILANDWNQFNQLEKRLKKNGVD